MQARARSARQPPSASSLSCRALGRLTKFHQRKDHERRVGTLRSALTEIERERNTMREEIRNWKEKCERQSLDAQRSLSETTTQLHREMKDLQQLVRATQQSCEVSDGFIFKAECGKEFYNRATVRNSRRTGPCNTGSKARRRQYQVLNRESDSTDPIPNWRAKRTPCHAGSAAA